jgi:hypothetical protein
MHFAQPLGSMLRSQKQTTSPYPEPDKSTQHASINEFVYKWSLLI